jgi:hypothetical protein
MKKNSTTAKVGRSRLHRTLDGNNRCLLEVRLFIIINGMQY